MFISTLDLFKIGIGPSSSHTMGPMAAALAFRQQIEDFLGSQASASSLQVMCKLKGSLAFTGKGHATDSAIVLGLHGYSAKKLAKQNANALIKRLWNKDSIALKGYEAIQLIPSESIIFDLGAPLPEHPNGMIFELKNAKGKVLLSETYFSIGGGFIKKRSEIKEIAAPLDMESEIQYPHDFDSASSMLDMAQDSGLSIAEMKHANELKQHSEEELNSGLNEIWEAMQRCIENGLHASGSLPGGLKVKRRAKPLFEQLQSDPHASLNDWLCAYAMSVNEENAAGHMVVTAPTNGAAGVIPAVLYYIVNHEEASLEQIRVFLLTAAAIGGLIKHRSSISGAEVGCQGEVGSAAAMAAAGLCAARGGSPQQVENAAEIALEHHLGMTCDPVEGLVQVPCIERNGFGAIKAFTAASLAKRGTGQHLISLDHCIEAMKQTGLEMSEKYKETSLGGLAVSLTEC